MKLRESLSVFAMLLSVGCAGRNALAIRAGRVSLKDPMVMVRLNDLLRGYVVSQAERAETEGIDERLAEFTLALDRHLAELAAEHNLVILPSKAVIEGAPDITPLLEKRLGIAAAPAQRGETP